MGTRVRSSIVLLAFVACVCSASARVIGSPGTRASALGDDGCGVRAQGGRPGAHARRAPPAQPNGAGLISIVSGGWQSSVEIAQIFAQAYPPLNEKGFTVFAVRHGSWPRYPLSSIVADMRRSVRFIRQHAKEYGVDPNRIGVFGSSAGGHLALLLGDDGRLRRSVGLRPGAQGIQSCRGGRGELSADGSRSMGDAAAGLQDYRRPKRRSSRPFASSRPARLPRSSCTATPTRPSRSIRGRRCTRR